MHSRFFKKECLWTVFITPQFQETFLKNLLHPFDLHFMDQHFNAFFEHHPLAFFLQGIFFKVFGNAVYTERIYSLVALFIQLLLLAKIYRRALPHKQHTFWLPMFLYTIVYSVFWAFSNNMLENTLGIFMLLSILLFQIYTAN